MQSYPAGGCGQSIPPPSIPWAAHRQGFTAATIAGVEMHSTGELLATMGTKGGGGGLFYADLRSPAEWSRLSDLVPASPSIDPARGLDRFYTGHCVSGWYCRWDWDVTRVRWVATSSFEDPFAPLLGTDETGLLSDPPTPGRLWSYGPLEDFLRTDDAMASWRSPGLIDDTVSAGAVSPLDPGIVLVATGGVIHRMGDEAGEDTLWQPVFADAGGSGS